MNTGEGVREHQREELHSTSDNTIQNFIYTFPFTPIPTTTLHILVLVCVKCVLLLHEPVFLNYINAMSNSFHSELLFTHPRQVPCFCYKLLHHICPCFLPHHSTVPPTLRHHKYTYSLIYLLENSCVGGKYTGMELLRHRIRPGLTTCYQIGL